jgi:hypothetical protein
MADLTPPALTAMFYKSGMCSTVIEDCRRIRLDEALEEVWLMEVAHLYWVRVGGQSSTMYDHVHCAKPKMPLEFNNIVAVGTDDDEDVIVLRFAR